MRTAGSVLIGILTVVLGYPVFTTTTGFSLNNLLVLLISILLWNTIVNIIERKE